MDGYTPDTSLSVRPLDATTPIDSTINIVRYMIQFGFGNFQVDTDGALSKIFIWDGRTRKGDGSNFRNELFFLPDAYFKTLPDAYEFPLGGIRFFAYDSQMASIQAVLNSGIPLALQTFSGRVFITSNIKSIPQ